MAKYGVRQFALCDIRPDSLKTTTKELKSRYGNVDVLEIETDTSKEASVNNAVAETVKRFSRLDIAVNNAGVGGAGKPSHEQELEDWRRLMAINLDGVWLCQRAEIRQMLKQDYLDPKPRGNRGVIVNVASMLGLVASVPSVAAVSYTSSKHGVMGMTKTDAIMYAPHGIRINAMCPGYIGTPLLKQATAAGIMADEVARVPQGRLGEIEEIADAISFLASPMSSFMCGIGLDVSGGYTC